MNAPTIRGRVWRHLADVTPLTHDPVDPIRIPAGWGWRVRERTPEGTWTTLIDGVMATHQAALRCACRQICLNANLTRSTSRVTPWTPEIPVQAAHGETRGQETAILAPPNTHGRLRYRPATLIGGPLNGQTTRIYPEPDTTHGAGPTEPPTITICMAIAWPHWEPTHWLDYHRHPDGTYHYSENRPLSGQDIPRAN